MTAHEKVQTVLYRIKLRMIEVNEQLLNVKNIVRKESESAIIKEFPRIDDKQLEQFKNNLNKQCGKRLVYLKTESLEKTKEKLLIIRDELQLLSK